MRSQKHVFVGREVGGFEVRQINHLRAELKEGYWAAGKDDCRPVKVTSHSWSAIQTIAFLPSTP